MPKGYTGIACSIGKDLGERRKAITSEPLPQRLAELLCRLAESERAEQARLVRQSSSGEGSLVCDEQLRI
jgi:hypothetical protein